MNICQDEQPVSRDHQRKTPPLKIHTRLWQTSSGVLPGVIGAPVRDCMKPPCTCHQAPAPRRHVNKYSERGGHNRDWWIAATLTIMVKDWHLSI